MKGLYVDRWHEGLWNKEQVDEMMLFAKDYTDLFIHIPTTKEPEFDALEYILSLKPKQKIHAYLSTLLIGRVGYEDRIKNIPKEWWMYDDNPFMPRIYLDPTIKEVQDYLINKCIDVVKKYEVSGLHFDRFRYPLLDSGKGTLEEKKEALDKIIQGIQGARIIRPLQISIAVREHDNAKEVDKCDYQDWYNKGYIDAICPMFFQKDITAHLNIWKTKPNVWVVIGWNHKELVPSDNFIFYSYATRGL